MICDDHNESNSPILTAILGSPRTASPSLPQQEVNASEHDNTLASLIGSENRGSELTSPVGDPEEARPSVEEDKQRKENMICDDHNESNSPILTAILGSPRTSSPSLQQQEVNASEHDNTLASLIGSENRGSELEIQEDVEADRELRTQDALHILSKVCDDYEIRNNEEAIKATNTIVDIINEQEDREDAAACSIVEYMMQEGLETMDDTPPEWNVQKQGYKWIEKMHEEKEKTPENTERRMTVYQNPVPISEIPLAEARERRTHAEMRPSPVLRSPFEIRAVHMKPTLNLDERDIYYYIVETEGTKDDTCAYTNGFVWASKGVFSSLKPHTEISIGVIDVWATYLNFRENERAETSPPRLI
ncbi:uncharacterized protein LOC121786801 [Salvia splendens]|uniref:uncharacterized protein LOC121786801 n=1 Tax=Salvia splendens TaxID=180675 RepID=UPI001C2642D4|nr:uncharacterized protein LOC121786801 [Salvia splendens]